MAVAFNDDGTVTLSRMKYELLIKSYKELNILEAYGVDSWDGYDDAMRELYPEEKEEEED